MFASCDNWGSQNNSLNLSFVKDEITVGRKMARNGPKKAINTLLWFPKKGGGYN